jgi:hypothetical protein
MAPQQQPKLQPQQQTASNSSDQQPVRTRISLSTLLSHPSKSFDAQVCGIETRNPSPLWTRQKFKQNRSGSKTKKTSPNLSCAVVGYSLTG